MTLREQIAALDAEIARLKIAAKTDVEPRATAKLSSTQSVPPQQ